MRKADKLRGWSRIWPAFGNPIDGFKEAWEEPAFYMEASFVVLMCPFAFAFVLGKTWFEVAALLATLVLVLIVELLNTGIESAIDRMGYEWNVMSKRVKDLGSAAVCLSLILCAATWLFAAIDYCKNWSL